MTLDQFVPGVRVFAMLKVGGDPPVKTYGVVGNAWSGEGPQLIVKFDDKGWVYVNEKNAVIFNLEPTN